VLQYTLCSHAVSSHNCLGVYRIAGDKLTEDKSACKLMRRGEIRPRFSIARLELARNLAMRSDSMDGKLSVDPDCAILRCTECTASVVKLMRMRLLQQTMEAHWSSAQVVCSRREVTIFWNVVLLQMGNWGLMLEKYPSIMPSNMASGGSVGAKTTLLGILPCSMLTNESIRP
jgi:hypothetical protein